MATGLDAGDSRTRWLAVKLAVLTAAVTALALGYTALFTWWRGPLDEIQGRFDGAAYDFGGAAPVAIPQGLPKPRAGADFLGAGQAWILDRGWIDQTGHRLTFREENALIRAARDASVDPDTHLHRQGIRDLVLYHPGDQFWTFQLIEAAIFLGLAAMLLLAAAWLVHRR